ncbi:DUF3141 domain-containing protein [Roseococcus sp. YIM B11640]|uniref:DUF3141 domain-containing protein n=1 Tax=Roseococcus sp. YIM B11640 TaxID=3133973 RepID=UPI003C79979A
MPNDLRPIVPRKASQQASSASPAAARPLPLPFAAFAEYWTDAMQRTVLLLDTLRQRGDVQIERAASIAPHVLSFDHELLVDGRNLERPVNYVLVRILPPAGTRIDPAKRPFIVFDPRAGHGPGIGGMKQDSEIGMALAAGHPCYFVGFLPDAVPGQTIEDVCRAEAFFVETVAARHQDAEGKPCLIGNCQAGWQIMMMCAIRPDLPGPIMLAGAPLSYWAGVRGKNPMRYTGGMLGGTWLTALAGDLGNGTFDGAHLIANFENLNPSNTYWKKIYNVYSKVDTETARFLDFETWWGNPVTLNAEEIQFIVDELFVGNRLASGDIVTSAGTRVDLRNITSPIIVFCSWGDDITPPQQALGWLTDLYETDADLIGSGQTVVYTVHQTIGHLGIFVSGKVATKEHGEFISCMDLIDMLPPGLYEAVITEKEEDTANPELVHGKYLFRLEPRGLADIRALGGNSPQDERRFETVARVSEINHGLYERVLAPVIRAASNDYTADLLRRTHPNRLRFELFSSLNPFLSGVGAMADMARHDRRPVSQDNPFLAMERKFSEHIISTLDAYAAARDAWTEQVFLATYGSPLLQALVGLGAQQKPHHHATRDLACKAAAERAAATLELQIGSGGLLDATLRGLIFVVRGDGRLDERAGRMIEAMRQARPDAQRISRERLRTIIRDQTAILRLDEERAIEALPQLLPDNAAARAEAMAAIRQVATAQGTLSEAAMARLARIEGIFIPPQALPEPPKSAARPRRRAR